MALLVTSASGANGNGYGSLLAFDRHGKPLGVFAKDIRIVDPRGLAVEQKEQLLFLNSIDRVLALDAAGKVVRDTGVIEKLNPGGGTFGPDSRYYIGLRSARTILALSVGLNDAGELNKHCRRGSFPFREASGSVPTADCSSLRASVPMDTATIPSSPFRQPITRARPGLSRTIRS